MNKKTLILIAIPIFIAVFSFLFIRHSQDNFVIADFADLELSENRNSIVQVITFNEGILIIEKVSGSIYLYENGKIEKKHELKTNILDARVSNGSLEILFRDNETFIVSKYALTKDLSVDSEYKINITSLVPFESEGDSNTGFLLHNNLVYNNGLLLPLNEKHEYIISSIAAILAKEQVSKKVSYAEYEFAEAVSFVPNSTYFGNNTCFQQSYSLETYTIIFNDCEKKEKQKFTFKLDAIEEGSFRKLDPVYFDQGTIGIVETRYSKEGMPSSQYLTLFDSTGKQIANKNIKEGTILSVIKEKKGWSVIVITPKKKMLLDKDYFSSP